jgi:hypothetical protein
VSVSPNEVLKGLEGVLFPPKPGVDGNSQNPYIAALQR